MPHRHSTSEVRQNHPVIRQNPSQSVICNQQVRYPVVHSMPRRHSTSMVHRDYPVIRQNLNHSARRHQQVIYPVVSGPSESFSNQTKPWSFSQTSSTGNIPRHYGLPVSTERRCIRHKWYRGFPAANHLAPSANQNVKYNVLREKPEERPPCSPHKLKHSDRAEKCLISNNTFKISSS